MLEQVMGKDWMRKYGAAWQEYTGDPGGTNRNEFVKNKEVNRS
jgi:hypothetical protein